MLETFCLESASRSPRLRIGLLLDSFLLPAWIVSILEQIDRSNYADLAFTVLNLEAEERTIQGHRPPLPVRLARLLTNRRRRSRILYQRYTEWDKGRIRPEDDPFRLLDCAELLSGIDNLRYRPIRKGFVHRFTEEQVQSIRSFEADVILRFGFNIIRGEILNCAKYGMWSYHHGDNDYYRGGPAHFWELYERHPLVGVLLQVLTEELDGGQVLCKAKLATQPGISVLQNRVAPYWVGSLFVIRKLHELHQYGWDHVCARAVPNRPAAGRNKIYRTPTNLQMIRFLAPRVLKYPLKLTRREVVAHWRIAIRTRPELFLTPEKPVNTEGFHWIESPKGHFCADPFLYEHGGKTWLFFEDFHYAERRGVISCAEIVRNGELGEPREVLRRPYHLSYPHVFHHEGETFMIPETGANGTVELYRAAEFPHRWELEQTLFSGAMPLDTTVWFENGRVWFFVTIVDPPGSGTQLFLFHADSLTGRWIYHPANPICMDERRSRGAGAIFSHAGSTIRPGQDGSHGYGYSFNWNQIIRLSLTDYEERPLMDILPASFRGLDGIHTYNRTEHIEVIDGNVFTPRSRVLVRA